MKTIETERLILRPLTESDDAAVYEYSCQPDVGPNAGWKPHESLDETREIMRLIFLNQEGVFGIVLKENGELIGTVGLIPDPKRENDGALMLGYAMSDKYWGRGIMTEAVRAALGFGFGELGKDVISAYCYPFNERSRRVLLKCRFKFEGLLRRCEKRYDGAVLDNECYSLLKEEYRQ